MENKGGQKRSSLRGRAIRIPCARYYDPKAGRFLSRDPIGFEGGDYNLYNYVGANPVNNIDPEGLSTLPTQKPLPHLIPLPDLFPILKDWRIKTLVCVLKAEWNFAKCIYKCQDQCEKDKCIHDCQSEFAKTLTFDCKMPPYQPDPKPPRCPTCPGSSGGGAGRSF